MYVRVYLCEREGESDKHWVCMREPDKLDAERKGITLSRNKVSWRMVTLLISLVDIKHLQITENASEAHGTGLYN